MGERTVSLRADGVRTLVALRTVLAALGCGLLAGIALGAIGPVELGVRHDLGLSPELAGWASSAITAVPAALGLAAGWWIRRLAPRPAAVARVLGSGARGPVAGPAAD